MQSTCGGSGAALGLEVTDNPRAEPVNKLPPLLLLITVTVLRPLLLSGSPIDGIMENQRISHVASRALRLAHDVVKILDDNAIGD